MCKCARACVCVCSIPGSQAKTERGKAFCTWATTAHLRRRESKAAKSLRNCLTFWHDIYIYICKIKCSSQLTPGATGSTTVYLPQGRVNLWCIQTEKVFIVFTPWNKASDWIWILQWEVFGICFSFWNSHSMEGEKGCMCDTSWENGAVCDRWFWSFTGTRVRCGIVKSELKIPPCFSQDTWEVWSLWSVHLYCSPIHLPEVSLLATVPNKKEIFISNPDWLVRTILHGSSEFNAPNITKIHFYWK